jgi:hypothetical protein
MRGHDFRGVNRAGDCYHDFAIGEEPVALEILSDLARIGELLLDLFVFRESQYILTRADESHDHRSLQSRLAQRLDQNTIGCAVESFEVVCNLRPAGNGAIVAGGKYENGFWRWDCC